MTSNFQTWMSFDILTMYDKPNLRFAIYYSETEIVQSMQDLPSRFPSAAVAMASCVDIRISVVLGSMDPSLSYMSVIH